MGLMHIYCGDGKGKTTAAIGLAIRASGAGMKVCFVQFMKGGETAELNTLRLIPEINVIRCDRSYPFLNNMTELDKSEITECHDDLLADAFNGGYDMIILDEFNSAYGYGLIDCKKAQELILNGKSSAEIVITGRGPADIFVDAADYISEIKCIRHPYEQGITARKGIEF